MSCSPNLLSSPPNHEPVDDEIHYSRIHSIYDHCLLTMIALKIRVLESMSQLERSHDQKDEATFVSKSVRLDLGKSRRRKGGAGRIGADCCYPSLSYSMLRCWLCCKDLSMLRCWDDDSTACCQDLSMLTKSFAISLPDQTYSACGLLNENDGFTAQDGWCLDETVVCLKMDV